MGMEITIDHISKSKMHKKYANSYVQVKIPIENSIVKYIR